MESTFDKKFANDYQVGGDHYRMDYEHWDFVRDLELDYFMASITKYMCRDKGVPQEQCDKACHFIHKRTEIIQGLPSKEYSKMQDTHALCGWWWPDQYEVARNRQYVYEFCKQLDANRSIIINQVLQWNFKYYAVENIIAMVKSMWMPYEVLK